MAACISVENSAGAEMGSMGGTKLFAIDLSYLATNQERDILHERD